MTKEQKLCLSQNCFKLFLLFFIERECKDSSFMNMEMRHHLQVAGSGPECLQQMTAFYTPSAVTKHILKGHIYKII